MLRRTVDLRVFLVTVAVMAAALILVTLAFAGVYDAPIEHRVNFQGGATASVVNYSTIVSQQNFTVSGIPAGALLGFTWETGQDAVVGTITAYPGPIPSGSSPLLCTSGPGFS